MDQIFRPSALQEQCLAWQKAGLSIALVPTMGFFHAGHESLMREGRKKADKLVVSLFVNPTQFSPSEDLSTYPQNLEKDIATAHSCGADILFTPSPADMYSPGHATWIEVPTLSDTMCGASRPEHFRGVCTVVAKLFMLAQPAFALFGEKDWQQLAIIRQMASDLFMPVDIMGMPTVREADGLALSSRNAYLSPQERIEAPKFYQGLCAAREAVQKGETDPKKLAHIVRQYWRTHISLGKEDYLVFVHPRTLAPLEEVTGPTLAAAALYLGKARLLDNIMLNGPAAQV